MAVMKRFLPTSALIGACALGMVCPAAAQSIDTNSASYNGGYGRVNGQENRPVAAGTRDANGNRVIIDGIIQTGVDQSVFAEASASASGEASGGVGIGSGASAIGNNLVVITQGNYNTVIVDSTQINNGDIVAVVGDE